MSRVDIRRANVILPGGVTYEFVRFIFFRGTIAIWREDLEAWVADRLVLISGATFTKRRTARGSHIVTFEDGEQWEIQPVMFRQCCGAQYPLRGLSYNQLLAEDFTHVGATP